MEQISDVSEGETLDIGTRATESFFSSREEMQRLIIKPPPKIPLNLGEAFGINHPPKPYSAPHTHPLPHLRADVPSLVDENQMIVNPLFAGEPSKTQWEEISQASKRLEEACAQDRMVALEPIFRMFEMHVPEFSTQFTQEQLDSLQNGNMDTQKQLEYAITGIVSANAIESDIGILNEFMCVHTGERVLKHIPQLWVRERIREAVHTWNQMLQSPYRNASLNSPQSYREKIVTREQNALRGRKLVEQGSEHIQYKADPRTKVTSLAGWSGEARCLVTNPETSGDHAKAITILLHELTHICQDNDTLRYGVSTWQESVNQVDSLVDNGCYLLDRELEAWYIDHSFVIAGMQSGKYSLEKVIEMCGLEDIISVDVAREILINNLHAYSSNTSFPLYSEKFVRLVIHNNQRRGLTPVREVSPGEFIAA